MYIEFLPPSPKAGQREHVIPRSAAEALIACGFAKALPPVRYGTNEYLAQRKALSALARTPDIHDSVVPFVEGVEWHAMIHRPSEHIVIQKRYGHTTEFYQYVSDGCPKDVAAQFNELKRTHPRND